MRFFCLQKKVYRATPCFHGTCRMMEYKKPESISERKVEKTQ